MTYNVNEWESQKCIFLWANHNKQKYPMLRWLHASLNGVKLTMKDAVMAKQTGMVKGISDIFLPYKTKNYSGLYIELKKESGGIVSKEQQEFIDFVTEQGFLAKVCLGHVESIHLIEAYILGH